MIKKIVLNLILVFGISSTLYAQKEIIGTITSTNGKMFIVECEKTDKLLSLNDTCNVSKDISGTKNPFGITVTSGWMGVADALFVSKKGNSTTFKVVRETSEIVINGKKQEHLVKGKKLKITWK